MNDLWNLGKKKTQNTQIFERIFVYVNLVFLISGNKANNCFRIEECGSSLTENMNQNLLHALTSDSDPK
jgi:hypothetical protein